MPTSLAYGGEMVETFLAWAVVGAIVCGAVGRWRGMTAEGAAMGLVLGPIIGPIVVLLTARYDPHSSAVKNR